MSCWKAYKDGSWVDHVKKKLIDQMTGEIFMMLVSLRMMCCIIAIIPTIYIPVSCMFVICSWTWCSWNVSYLKLLHKYTSDDDGKEDERYVKVKMFTEVEHAVNMFNHHETCVFV